MERAALVVVLLLGVACASTASAPRSAFAGRLETPLGPLAFGLELALESGSPVEFWNAGVQASSGVLERAGETWSVELGAGQRFDLRGSGDSGPMDGEWRCAGQDPVPVVLERVSGAMLRSAPPPASEAAPLSGTWRVVLGRGAGEALLEFDPANPGLARLDGALGAGVLSAVSELEPIYVQGLCATLSRTKLTLAGFDGRRAWLLEGTLEAGDEFVGSLWSSELGGLSWTARRESPVAAGR